VTLLRQRRWSAVTRPLGSQRPLLTPCVLPFPLSLPQAEIFNTLDGSFAELAQLLQFCDKRQERVKKAVARQQGALVPDEAKMEAWDRELKGSAAGTWTFPLSPGSTSPGPC
jgi:hypothetical protein